MGAVPVDSMAYLLRADLPNGRTTPIPLPGIRANHLLFLLAIPPPPPMGRALLLTCALRERAHFDPQHWLLHHTGNFYFEFELWLWDTPLGKYRTGATKWFVFPNNGTKMCKKRKNSNPPSLHAPLAPSQSQPQFRVHM